MSSMVRIELLRLWRNPRLLFFTMILPGGFYLLYTSIYSGMRAFEGTTWAAYYMVSMAVFGGIGATLSTLGTRLSAERAGGWTKLLRATPLSPAAYVLAKVLVAILGEIPAVLLLFVLAATQGQVALTFATWSAILGWTIAGTVPFAALGLLIGYLFDSQSAQAGQTIIWLALAFLGGLWQPVASMPSGMQDVAKWLPTYRAADLAWSTLGGNPNYGQDILILLAYTIVFGAVAAILYRRDSQREYA